MSIHKTEKLFSKEWMISYSYIIVGCILFAIGDVMFVNPYKLAPGGVYGIATVLHSLYSWQLSACALSMEIPLLILGTIILGPRFGFKTLFSTFLIMGLVWLIENSWGYAPVIHAGKLDAVAANGLDFVPDYFINTLASGVIYGISIGLIFKSGATSGGSDIIAMIMNKFTKISLGTLVIIIDSLITLSTLALGQGLYLPLYSILVIVIEGVIIDLIVDGVKKHKTLLIVTNKPEDVGTAIISEIKRGATCFKAQGMHEGTERTMIYTTVTGREYIRLKEGLRLIDPEVFISVVNSSEVLGKGFKPLP